MHDFNKLWECAINMHESLHKPGNLMLAGRTPHIRIEAISNYYDNNVEIVALGDTPCNAVRKLIADYAEEAAICIEEIRRDQQANIDKLEGIINQAKLNGCE